MTSIHEPSADGGSVIPQQWTHQRRYTLLQHCCGNEIWVGYGIVVHEVTDVCAVFPIGLLLMEKFVDVNRWRCEIFGIIDLVLFSVCRELTMYTRIITSRLLLIWFFNEWRHGNSSAREHKRLVITIPGKIFVPVNCVCGRERPHDRSFPIST